MAQLVFLKLGGSLITEKTGVESLRKQVLERLAREIRAALSARPGLHIVMGHGSGSFGHVAASKYNTRQGVNSRLGWRGFAEVSDAAARLNTMVRQVLIAAGIPALTLQPSANVRCRDGRIVAMDSSPILAALEANLIPLIYGDVAFDGVRGGTIVSTEELLAFLVPEFRPKWLLLAGQTAGVYDQDGKVIASITPSNIEEFRGALGGSSGTDVTGGMESKVHTMLSLVQGYQELSIRIFSGLEPDSLYSVLLDPARAPGTVIRLNGRTKDQPES